MIQRKLSGVALKTIVCFKSPQSFIPLQHFTIESRLGDRTYCIVYPTSFTPLEKAEIRLKRQNYYAYRESWCMNILKIIPFFYLVRVDDRFWTRKKDALFCSRTTLFAYSESVYSAIAPYEKYVVWRLQWGTRILVNHPFRGERNPPFLFRSPLLWSFCCITKSTMETGRYLTLSHCRSLTSFYVTAFSSSTDVPLKDLKKAWLSTCRLFERHNYLPRCSANAIS